MPYYVRVLSTSSDCVQLSKIQSGLERYKKTATVSVEQGLPDDWTQIILSHVDGPEISLIERNLVEDESLGTAELGEFADEIRHCKPESAAEWLLEYFPRVRCIYAFQVLSGVYHQNGWDILGSVKNVIWSAARSILQADNEGFSNEDGYHILWQFNDSVQGPWWMGVLHDGEWIHFQMDLGNQQ